VLDDDGVGPFHHDQVDRPAGPDLQFGWERPVRERPVDGEVRLALALPDEALGGVDGALGLRRRGQIRPGEELQRDGAAVAQRVEAGQGLPAAPDRGEYGLALILLAGRARCW